MALNDHAVDVLSVSRGPSQHRPVEPWMRPGLVQRSALLSRLQSSVAPIVTVVAPSGYGKTTLLTQWAAASPGRSISVSLDHTDNDPAVLLGHVIAAADAVGPRSSSMFEPLTPTMPAVTTASVRIAPALTALPGPYLLAFDHLELLHNTECLDAVGALAANLPREWRMAIASRTQPPLPMARLRAEGRVLEISLDDLAMDDDDARALLAAEGLELDGAAVADLVQRTEGWPVGLYLAALALRARGHHDGLAMAFSGDDRLLADYVRTEILERLPSPTVSFLTRTSILDTMSGPLCDAVLATAGSQQVLESLERSNLLLVPLDRRREEYRYHHLFRQLLRTELERTEPALVPDLHARAVRWFEAAGQRERALAHAQRAGDADRAADLLAGLVQPTYASGRGETVREWLRWFDDRGLIDHYPQIAVQGAFLEASLGRPAAAERLTAAAERWAAAPEHRTDEMTMPDGSSLASYFDFNRANMCAHGVAQMRRDAADASHLVAPGNALRGGALALEALSYYLDGDHDVADARFAHAFDVAVYLGGSVAAVTASSLRATIAIARGDWASAQSLNDISRDIIETAHLGDYGHALITFAVAARLDVSRGDVVSAKANVARATRLRPMLTYAIPWSATFLLQLGHAYLELADPTGARAVLREVRDILQQRPDLGTVAHQADALHEQVDTIRQRTVGASSITAAELRLLPFLATHLSFREIGERVHVSRHTVKSQAIAVYRKLGVSSRSEAIDRIREIGLLGSAPNPVTRD